MGFFNKKKKSLEVHDSWEITRDCLNLIFECSKSSYPNEFGGLLRVDDQRKHRIVELVILPGTISGDSHAIFRMNMRPIDFSIVGTIHSHPSPFAVPSEADLSLFGKYGNVHIISASPFNDSSWRAFDYLGNEIVITVV